MQFLLAFQIRRFVMRKLFVGIVAVVSAAGGVAACGKNGKTPEKTSAAQTASVIAPRMEPKLEKVSDVKLGTTYATTVVGGSQSEALETGPKPALTLVLSEGKSGFKFRSATLSEAAKAKIDAMFTGDKIDMKNARFEIEGYTDNLGSPELNHQVGLARAEAVRQYLGEQHEIHKDCISVVSYGMENPVADNSTPEGRARNRRVVIKVWDEKVVD
jgi:outer membrane protein OmpA-like peptidoglycan-associated protein